MEETAENKSSVTPYRYALRGLRGEMEKPAPFPIGMSVSKATAVSALEETEILMKTVAMDTVEPHRPECGSLVEPTATDVVEPTLHPAGSTQMLDGYRNGNRRASEARFGSACRN